MQAQFRSKLLCNGARSVSLLLDEFRSEGCFLFFVLEDSFGCLVLCCVLCVCSYFRNGGCFVLFCPVPLILLHGHAPFVCGTCVSKSGGVGRGRETCPRAIPLIACRGSPSLSTIDVPCGRLCEGWCEQPELRDVFFFFFCRYVVPCGGSSSFKLVTLDSGVFRRALELGGHEWVAHHPVICVRLVEGGAVLLFAGHFWTHFCAL